MQLLAQKDELIPQPDRRLGHGPAKYYLLKQTGALVGFIGALTNEHFCDNCNKMRLTADGKVRPVPRQSRRGGFARGVAARRGRRRVEGIVGNRAAIETAGTPVPQQYQPCRPMTAIGG